MRLFILMLLSFSLYAANKPIVVMTCSIDQYKIRHDGYRIPTYLQCKNKMNEEFLYMLVPDHQTSERRSIDNQVQEQSAAPQVDLIPEVQPAPVPSFDDEDDDDDSSSAHTSSKVPKI